MRRVVGYYSEKATATNIKNPNYALKDVISSRKSLVQKKERGPSARPTVDAVQSRLQHRSIMINMANNIAV